jgi:hypothetical protein
MMIMHPKKPGVAIASLTNTFLPTNGFHSPTVNKPVKCPSAYLGTTHRPERVANAYLIAAAPDLLEACRKALTCASLDSAVREVVESAVRKAKNLPERVPEQSQVAETQ